MSRKRLSVFSCALVLSGIAALAMGEGPGGRQQGGGSPPERGHTRGGPPPHHDPKLGDPFSTLTAAELTRFKAGQGTFEEVHEVSAGLGPVFNDNACAACHTDGGIGGGSSRLVTRFGRLVGGQFDPMTQFGGELIQAKGIGKIGKVTFVGEVVPPQATISARRKTTPLFGLGLVDAVPDHVFFDIANHQAQMSPLTGGRVNVVLDTVSGQERVGKFGWKCQQATLKTFAGDAYLNEMGITTPMFPIENCPQGNCALLSAPGLPAVPNEADNTDVFALADYMSFLAPPPLPAPSPQSQAGSQWFQQIGCADCHLPRLQTGPNASPSLNNATFFPYSDFLLHDMGSLGDGIMQSGAGPREMRTAPLWGLSQVTTFLHDGRATSLSAAITAHDGQGAASAKRFKNLNSNQQNQLLQFLKSL